MTGGSVLQNGSVTPSHIATWTTDGVIQDGGASIPSLNSMLSSIVQLINFNVANNDNPIPINLPLGYTRYRIHNILISGASATLTTSTVGVFTAPAAGGTAVVTTGTGVTVSASAIDTNNNMQSLSINDQNTMAFSDTVLFFRTQTPQSAPGTATVSVFYQPLP